MLAGLQSRYLLAFLALITGLVCASCASTITLAPGRTLAVALSEYRIRPSRIAARAGTLTIVVHNYGLLTHDLVITPVSAQSKQPPVADSGGLAPGRSETLHVTVKPGSYRLTSDIAVDQSVGQTGTLTVTSK